MEMGPDKDCTMITIYEASMEGSVSTLKSLTEKDPLILNKISVNRFGETPLHISAMLGHLNFTKELLSHKPKGPKLAGELDSLKRSPLHLASAEGHAEIVQALLEANKDMCLVRDEDGKIPLHYATMRGHVEVIKLLISSQPESIWEMVNEGDQTVLHLCVQYNHFKALQVLAESADFKRYEFLNSKEKNHGNTILHLAVMLKQTETIKYLISLPEVKKGAETLNTNGFTAFDMVEHLPKDFKSLIIEKILEEARLPRSIRTTKPFFSYTNCWKIFSNYMQKYDCEWLEDRSGSIMVVATVIATMTFQTAIAPPGGVWGEHQNSSISDEFHCSPQDLCLAGTSVIASAWPYDYLKFIAYNSNAFLASLSIIVLLISGLPFKYKISMWLLSVAMLIALTFMTLTFLHGMYLVTPYRIEGNILKIYDRSYYTWIALLGIIAMLHTTRFLFAIGRVIKLKILPNVKTTILAHRHHQAQVLDENTCD